MTQHTPGPWTVQPCQADHGETTVICDADCNIIARLFLVEDDAPGWKHPDSQEGKDARLMAGSPAMLAALKRADIAVEQLCHGQDSANECWNILREIRAAITAAS